ncbi:hypothetical protein FYJ58_09740 [Lachnospiraceae bacterium WCA-693-APC-MOT-I]|uniref:Uncharacterized protein n=1 Tax=Velocimicrobium porci TaxID=2606634 RepID=A0A6L5XZK8_9FIRM|nr:hypothetical protein [Velocimicrobium porci]MSS64154.1 hypothetical protein [Velocimicrobium porci]
MGVILNVWLNKNFTPEILLGGLASGLASVGASEAIYLRLTFGTLRSVFFDS